MDSILFEYLEMIRREFHEIIDEKLDDLIDTLDENGDE